MPCPHQTFRDRNARTRIPKMGIRGTATVRFALRTSKFPKGKCSRPPAKVSSRADVLEFRANDIPARVAGRANTCLRLAIEHANRRKQSNKTLGNFHLVQKTKSLASRQDAYAIEAMTHDHLGTIYPRAGRLPPRPRCKSGLRRTAFECINDDFRFMALLRILSTSAGGE